jgi:hypothetical protein
MKTYNEICGGDAKGYVGTGAFGQCLEAVTVLMILSKNTFKFDTIADFKDKAKWEEGILSGELVPLFELYELASANTEEVFYESRNFKKRTQKAAKVTTAEMYLDVCSQAAIRAYHNSEYNRIFEVTEDGDIIGVYDTDGIKIKGQLVKDFNVGIRQVATTEKPPTTQVTITYGDYEELEHNAVIVAPNFDPVDDLNGVFNIMFTQVGAGSATSIVVDATMGCAGDALKLAATDLKLYLPDGTAQTATAVESTTQPGRYTFTGTGLVTGLVGVDSIKKIGDILITGKGIVTV